MFNRFNCHLKSLYRHSSNFIKAMSDEPASKKIKYDGRIKKRNWEERKSAINCEERDKTIADQKADDAIRIKRRKYAVLLGYSGVDYYGMQRNPNMQTIEEDFLKALLKAELITNDAFSQVQTIQFQRAARTDKGVSAARQVVSLKLPEEVDVASINKELPDSIRVFSVMRVTKGFNSKSNCDARTYTYMLPTFAFAHFHETVDPQTFRIAQDTREKINETLKLFLGSKNYHNFTSRKKPRDPSAMRYIILFECGKPFVKENVEFTVLKVKGQSFMLHQIRKMVGLTIAVVRGHTSAETIQKAWSSERLDLPMAPGLGLVLDQVHYDRYNVRYGSDGVHQTLDWHDVEPSIATFKEDFIYPTIVNTEITDRTMMAWLETLEFHSFDVRKDDENDNQLSNTEQES